MRKLLVFMLVLGIASAAHAAYVPTTLTFSGPSTAAKNVEFTVTVTISGLASGRSLTQYDDGDITGTGLAHTEGAITPAPTFNTSISDYADWIDVMLASSATPGVPNNSTVMTFKVTPTADGTLTLGMADSAGKAFVVMLDNNDQSYLSYGTDFGPITVNTLSVVVPEPMTIALLGLGGLFLRRRR